ncbi:MAG: exodeoxyribonuclease VII large subunit, partial [Deltaproteobacteria bacterium]|nr:exodeoxyribonuclease VII large subunit [Deltaproteobacteria bacterium]
MRLNVILSSGEARFSGPATFQLKDRIKALGTARWLAAEKAWLVSSASLSEANLRSYFAGVELVIESGTALSNPGQVGAVGTTTLHSETSVPAVDFASALPVSQLLAQCELALSRAFQQTVFVTGVLSKVKATGGRVFMDLSDRDRPEETVSCVIWDGAERMTADLAKVGFTLEEQLEVMFEVSVRFNRRRGAVSCTVVRIVPEYTLGKLAALREQTNQRLRDEGLFDRNRQRPLAFLPRRLALLTSSAGTVINDFLASLSVAEFGFDLVWLPVSVQGANAKTQILQALERFSRDESLDAILIFRGGGSPAELAVFSDYDIARAVALAPHPVFSAIGHEEDQTSTQDVSFRSFGVPKDLGRFFSDLVIEHRRSVFEVIASVCGQIETRLVDSAQRLESLALRVRTSAVEMVGAQSAKMIVGERLRAMVQERMSAVEGSLERFSLQIGQSARAGALAHEHRFGTVARQVIDSVQRRIDLTTDRLTRFRELPAVTDRALQRAEERAQHFAAIIRSASPTTQLRRGFSLLRDAATGDVITSGAGLKPGQQISIQLRDHMAVGSIQKVEELHGRREDD